MQLSITNTRTHSKEIFVPREAKKVTMYSCGPTVYADPHIGNMRSYVFADTLVRTLSHVLGYQVSRTVNITDVGHLVSDGDDGEDKLQKGAKREGKTAREVAKFYENNFKKYLAEMNITTPTHLPRATDYIAEQIAIVQQLEAKGLTYRIEDGIYYDTSKISDYGKLLPEGHLAGIEAWARVEDTGKKNITDFALRKFSPAGEVRDMERESPWGKGFPGWHIECSAMSRATLGEYLDIHTGGIDHIPIHHTNEIAQSEHSFCEHTPWVNYRVHNQFLNINNEKISKSLGNTFTLPDVTTHGSDPLDLRYFYLQAQYRSFQDFSWDALDAAAKSRKNLSKKLGNGPLVQPDTKIQTLLQETILDDLNTPKLLAGINTLLSDADDQTLGMLRRVVTNVLGLTLKKEQEEVTEDASAEILELAAHRETAKKEKNRPEADRLREKIAHLGRKVTDTATGPKLEKL